MRIFSIATICFMMTFLHHAGAQSYEVVSPGEALKIRVTVANEIHYEVFHNNIALITPSRISMTLEDGRLIGKNGTVKDAESKSVKGTIPILYGKNGKSLDETYHETIIHFNEGYSLVVRAYDEGAAYRFETKLGGMVTVKSEEATFNFAGVTTVWFPEADALMRSWERSYRFYNSIKDIPSGRFAITPSMFSYPQTGIRVVVAESDQRDYPGMYVEPSGETAVKGKWAQYPKTVSDPNNMYAYQRVLERYDYLAITKGDRAYPWRVVIVSTQDKDLLNNELIFKLALPQQISYTNWIKPGKSAWEWWHDGILEGVSIPSGKGNMTFEVYKYYIDFAAKHKIEYLTLDAGYNCSVKQVCDYARSLGVGVFVWDYINLPVWNPNRISELKGYGAVGLKVDLIERDDQIAMNWIEKLAKDCADREMMLVLHGNPKPSGLNRAYPNIVNFEAVRGAECSKWDHSDNPDYHTQYIFIRMLAGPLDATPGSMRNVTQSQFRPIDPGIPMTMGTRAHELAMFVLFDQPLAYLCDSPIEYDKYPDIMRFLSKVPSIWDLTVPLAGEVGEYAAIARKRGDEWYVGAMTNWKARPIEIDFSFLPDDATYVVELYRDTDQSTTNAKSYLCESVTVTKQSKMTFQMAPGGGVAMRLVVENTVQTGVNDMIGYHHGSDGSIVVNTDKNRQILNIESTILYNQITLYDMKGVVMLQKSYNHGTHTQQIDIGFLQEGVYIVKITGKAGNQSVKFIK